MTILAIITGAPIWVWVIFVYLLIVGIKLTRPSVVPFFVVSIAPFIVLGWSFSSVYQKFLAHWPLLILWSCVFAVGTIIGQYLMNKTGFSFDPQTKLFHIPGSWMPFFIFLAFFSVKYTLGATYTLMPEMQTNLALMGFDVAISALLAGMLWGRFIPLLLAYQRNR